MVGVDFYPSHMSTQEWYAQLIRPDWAPPSWLFGPVWSVLYAIIFLSFGYVFWKCVRREWSWTVGLPFVVNLIANLAFSPLQFGLQNNLLAALDIIVVLATLVWMMIAVWPRARWVALVNIPYLLWVSFATVLQLTITYLNW